MAVKKKNKSKPANKELSNKIYRLEVMLKFTTRAIDGRSEQLDSLFSKQADRLMDEIKKVKENQ
jgi:hypothetical protein